MCQQMTFSVLSYSGCTIEELLTVNDNEAQDFVRRSEVGHIVIVIFLVEARLFSSIYYRYTPSAS